GDRDDGLVHAFAALPHALGRALQQRVAVDEGPRALVRCALPEAVEELAVLAHDPRPQRPGHAGERARVAVAVVLAAVVHRDRLARLRADDARAGPAAVALVLADEHDVRVREEA